MSLNRLVLLPLHPVARSAFWGTAEQTMSFARIASRSATKQRGIESPRLDLASGCNPSQTF